MIAQQLAFILRQAYPYGSPVHFLDMSHARSKAAFEFRFKNQKGQYLVFLMSYSHIRNFAEFDILKEVKYFVQPLYKAFEFDHNKELLKEALGIKNGQD